MANKTIKFLNGGWLPVSGDRSEYFLDYSIADTDFIGQPEETPQTQTRRIVVGISRTLATMWQLNEVDLEKVLFEYANRYIQDKVFDNTLSEYEEIQLSSYNAPSKCPFDPIRIEPHFGKEFSYSEAEEVLPERIATIKSAAKIIDMRDNINALFAGKFRNSLLTLPQERGLLELFRSCNNQEEFAYRVASLSTLVTAIETGNIKSYIHADKNDKPLDILGKFLRSHFSAPQTDQIMNTFQAFNRLRRMYPIHTDRAKGVMESHNYFGLEYPITNYQLAWAKLLDAYIDSLNALLALLKTEK